MLNFFKIRGVMFHQINLVKNSYSKLRSARGNKNDEKYLQMNELATWKVTVWIYNLKN